MLLGRRVEQEHADSKTAEAEDDTGLVSKVPADPGRRQGHEIITKTERPAGQAGLVGIEGERDGELGNQSVVKAVRQPPDGEHRERQGDGGIIGLATRGCLPARHVSVSLRCR